MSVSAIIPARMGSIRFPGKPLRKINGLPMIHHVVNQAKNANIFEGVYVATDSDEICEYCNSVDISFIKTGNLSDGNRPCFSSSKEYSSGKSRQYTRG